MYLLTYTYIATLLTRYFLIGRVHQIGYIAWQPIKMKTSRTTIPHKLFCLISSCHSQRTGVYK